MIEQIKIINKQKIYKNKQANIQLLKFILCLFVVFHHYFLYFLWFKPLLNVSVSIFAMITGYFLCNKNTKYKMIEFLPTLLFLWIFNIILNLLFSSLSKNNWIEILLTGNNWAWWYLSAISIIYLLAPFLNLLILIIKKKIIIVILLIYLTFQIYSFFFGQKFLWIIPLFYCYLIGAFVSLYGKEYLQNNKIIVTFVTIIFFLLSFWINFLNIFVFPKSLYLTYSPLTIFCATSFFCLFLSFNIKSNNFIIFLGDLSLFIFAYHMFFYFLMKNISSVTKIDNFILISSALLLTFFWSLFLYYIFNIYIKYIKLIINKIINCKFVIKYIYWINFIFIFIMFCFYIIYFI